MYSLMTTPLCNYGVSKLPFPSSFNLKHNYPKFLSFRKALQIHVNATNEVDAQTGTVEEEPKEENLESEPRKESKSISSATSTTPLDKDLKKVQIFFFLLDALLSGFLKFWADFEDVFYL